MAQHLREGSEVNVTYEGSGGTVTLSSVTVTNLTESYIETESGGTGKVVAPWSRVFSVNVITD